jgi:putative DNA methylase
LGAGQFGGRTVSIGTNALASSIVIVCRPRPDDAKTVTRRDFMAKLREELPDALIRLQHGNVAPVDLAQATIGPGMAVYSRYAKVLEADGSPMTVRTALALINQELDAYLEALEGELDADTRFCIAWYDQYGHKQAAYGEADVLARAKNTSVAGLHEARVLKSEGGKVRLLRREEYDADWNPLADRRKPVWECAQHLILRFETGGAEGAGALLAQLGPEMGENARALAYRLYTLCERRGRAEDALAYNGLVTAWPEIQREAAAVMSSGERQGRLGV